MTTATLSVALTWSGGAGAMGLRSASWKARPRPEPRHKAGFDDGTWGVDLEREALGAVLQLDCSHQRSLYHGPGSGEGLLLPGRNGRYSDGNPAPAAASSSAARADDDVVKVNLLPPVAKQSAELGGISSLEKRHHHVRLQPLHGRAHDANAELARSIRGPGKTWSLRYDR